MRLQEISRVGAVPHAWLGITNSMSSRPLLTLRKAVDDQGVDASDTAAVKGVWDTLVADARARAAALQDESVRDRQEYEARVAARAEERESLSIILRGR
jgi:hypothetical protein